MNATAKQEDKLSALLKEAEDRATYFRYHDPELRGVLIRKRRSRN